MSELKTQVRESALSLKSKFNIPWAQSVYVVLGSGFKHFADAAAADATIEINEIPHFRQPRVAGHGSKLVFSNIEGRSCVIATGRIHMYEGYSAADAVFSIRVMAELGVKAVVLTNAAGSLQIARKPGEAVILSDHINLTGKNCLIGDGAHFGKQFVDMVNAYDRDWRDQVIAKTSAKPGVYAGLIGPNYETPAETKMLGLMGADVVGMSTVQETMAARQAGMKVAALSLITNYAGGLSASVDHQEVLEVGKHRAQEMLKILTTAIHCAPL